MSRPLRLEFPGAIHHVTARGNARGDIFPDDEDRSLFLAVLAEAVIRFGWLCHAYCLMDNHYHLLIETPHGNLSPGMRQINGVYTQRFNRCHARTGHLFQGRFKAILVERDSYLLELCRYIVLNPVRAGMVTDIDDYAAFVAQGKNLPSPCPDLKGQVLFGSAHFAEQMQPLLAGKSGVKEIPRSQRLAHRPDLDALFPARVCENKPLRDEAIRRACLECGYTMAAIAHQTKIHYSTISKIIKGER